MSKIKIDRDTIILQNKNNKWDMFVMNTNKDIFASYIGYSKNDIIDIIKQNIDNIEGSE